MVLNRLAAIFFFSGPLFYLGLLMLVDPAGIASLPEMLARALREFHRALIGLPAQRQSVGPEQAGISRKGRSALRLVGLALVVSGLLFSTVV